MKYLAIDYYVQVVRETRTIEADTLEEAKAISVDSHHLTQCPLSTTVVDVLSIDEARIESYPDLDLRVEKQ